MTCQDIAIYLISCDSEGLFADSIIKINGNVFIKGEIRLALYLYLAQVIYIGRTRTKLFLEDLYIEKHGIVCPKMKCDYRTLVTMAHTAEFNFECEEMRFLHGFAKAFANASLGDLCELVCEEPEWIKSHSGAGKYGQKIDFLPNYLIYKKQYQDINRIIEQFGEEENESGSGQLPAAFSQSEMKRGHPRTFLMELARKVKGSAVQVEAGSEICYEVCLDF